MCLFLSVMICCPACVDMRTFSCCGRTMSESTVFVSFQCCIGVVDVADLQPPLHFVTSTIYFVGARGVHEFEYAPVRSLNQPLHSRRATLEFACWEFPCHYFYDVGLLSYVSLYVLCLLYRCLRFVCCCSMYAVYCTDALMLAAFAPCCVL